MKTGRGVVAGHDPPTMNLARFACSVVLSASVTTVVFGADDILVADFEGQTYGDWQVAGEAFGPGPAKGTLPRQMRVSGFKGERLVNSFFKGDRTVGTLTSPAFKIERPFIKFLIGGGGYKNETYMQLLIAGKPVRTALGPNSRPGGSERLAPMSWDVREFLGRKAVIRIVDQRRGGWGHINVDHIVQSDTEVKLLDARRTIKLTDRYLHLPIRTGAKKSRLKVLLDGRSIREMDVELAVGEKPSLVAAIDLMGWIGKTVTLDAGKIYGEVNPLDAVKQSRALPNRDGIYKEPIRPLFHFTSKIGWLNDPNGLVYHQGVWHLFYQHNPYGWNWGNMHWGHATSRDLFHWQEQGDAIFPWADTKAMAFSGCAVIDQKNTSGFGGPGDPPLIVSLTDTGAGEVIGYSMDNGRTIKLYEGNPVITHKGRDPKIIWHEPTRRWVMALYDEFEGKRWIAFYSSPDLKKWTLHSRLEGYYECPDLFELPVDGDKSKTRWVVYGADGKYAVGSFDGKTFTPDHEGKHQIWYGNFYAAQTYDNTPKGRRIQIGWGRGITFPNMPFNQQMCVPVELTLRTTDEGIRMFAEPVSELENLKGKATRPDKLDAEAFAIDVRYDVSDNPVARLRIRGVDVSYDGEKNLLICGGKRASLNPDNGKIRLMILGDRGSLEVFANDGRVAVSHGVLLDKGKPVFAVDGKHSHLRVTSHPLKPIW